MPEKKVGGIDFSDGIVDLSNYLVGKCTPDLLRRGNGKNVGLVVLKPVPSISSLLSSSPEKVLPVKKERKEGEGIRRNAKCQAVQLLPRGIYSVRYATLMEFDEATL